MLLRRSATPIGAALACLLLNGCGGPKASMIPVKGRVIQGGKPLVPGGGEALIVTFCAEDGPVPGAIFQATTGADGTFEVPGPQKRGIPPGRYRVSVALLVIEGRGKQTDRLRDAFSLARTPLVEQVAAGKEAILDLGPKR